MRRIEGEQVLLRIFIGESDKWEGRPLHGALLELFRRRGLAGATILKAVAGFGAHSIIHTTRIDVLSGDLPIVIEVVDAPDHVEAVIPEVERMMSGGLLTMEKVRVIRYTGA